MVDATALIVEDSSTQAQIIARMIEAQGWSTLHCATIREATDSLMAVSVQALFLDIFVGQHNALLHMDRFRKLLPHTPIIVMTAGSGKEAIEETLKAARKTGADFVLRKPFNDAILADVFQSAFPDANRRGRRQHVLVIDDSSTIRRIAAAVFEAAGFRVSTAGSMEEAFVNVDIAHVDLVLCDIFMPGMGGFKGMRTIKQTWPSVKIIAMSAGYGDKVDDSEALNAARKVGADAQISKPFTAESLLELIDAIMPAPAKAA